MSDESPVELRLQGAGVSPGVAHGVIHVIRDDFDDVPRYSIDSSQIPGEIARFEQALIQTRHQILEMQQKIAESIGAKDAGIFDAHLLVVEDRTLIDEVIRVLQREKLNVEHVFHEVADRYAKTLAAIDDPYLRERAVDIHDVMRRVVHNLMGKEGGALNSIHTPHLLVAHNLTPSDTAQLNRTLVLGFATDIGSKTSHTAIMARSLSIPAVVGLHDISKVLNTGDHILLDGYNGVVVINPGEQTLYEYGQIESKKEEVEKSLTNLRDTISTTQDGRHITLSANIELPGEVASVKENGAEGIGLYRT